MPSASCVWECLPGVTFEQVINNLRPFFFFRRNFEKHRPWATIGKSSCCWWSVSIERDVGLSLSRPAKDKSLIIYSILSPPLAQRDLDSRKQMKIKNSRLKVRLTFTFVRATMRRVKRQNLLASTKGFADYVEARHEIVTDTRECSTAAVSWHFVYCWYLSLLMNHFEVNLNFAKQIRVLTLQHNERGDRQAGNIFFFFKMKSLSCLTFIISCYLLRVRTELSA